MAAGPFVATGETAPSGMSPRVPARQRPRAPVAPWAAFPPTVKPNDPADCLHKFRANEWLGWMLLAGILAARF